MLYISDLFPAAGSHFWRALDYPVNSKPIFIADTFSTDSWALKEELTEG